MLAPASSFKAQVSPKLSYALVELLNDEVAGLDKNRRHRRRGSECLMEDGSLVAHSETTLISADLAEVCSEQ
jgi:hypothetical protein